MVHKLVQTPCSYLFLRGRTYYFRFALPTPLRRKFPSLPAEVKRSLRTDSYSDALALISKKLPLIKLIQRCSDLKSVKSLIDRLVDFSREFHVWVSERLKLLQQKASSSSVRAEVVSPALPVNPEGKTPKLSKIWKDFVAWKSWPEKRRINNQRLFDNLVFFIGDKPVGEITKQHLRSALNSIAKLPQRNLKPYRSKPLEEIVKMKVPSRDRVSAKYVREHLKICQSLFSRFMVQEIDLLEKSPTAGLRLETEDSRFGALTDEQVCLLLDQGKGKQKWFYLVLMLAIYTGARRSEIANLRRDDVKFCSETGRYYLVIHKGKTKAARRQIPVHQELVKAGLIDWAQGTEDLLFPEAAFTPNSITNRFTSLNIDKKTEDGERIVFHSLRHTFITKARSKGIEAVLVQEVVGHEKTGSGVTDRYTHRFTLENLLPVVDSVTYQGA